MITGETIDRKGIMNPQIRYGEDVMSRINFAIQSQDNMIEIQKVVVDSINKTVFELCNQNSLNVNEIIEMTVVGNTAMHHLFLGLPVKQLGLAPFLPLTNETFNVKLYYDGNMITELTITDLPPDQEVTIVFTWDTSGVAGGNYTITVEAEILEYELNVTNNIFTDGTIQIRLLGDIDGNCSVDMHDLYLAALAFGSYEGHPDWNPYADLDQNGIIDMRDLFYVASNFGKVCP